MRTNARPTFTVPKHTSVGIMSLVGIGHELGGWLGGQCLGGREGRAPTKVEVGGMDKFDDQKASRRRQSYSEVRKARWSYSLSTDPEYPLS